MKFNWDTFEEVHDGTGETPDGETCTQVLENSPWTRLSVISYTSLTHILFYIFKIMWLELSCIIITVY